MSDEIVRVGDVAVAPQVQLPPELMPSERFVGGFDGMATSAFDWRVTSILGARVNPDDVEIKPDGIVYLPGVFYRDMLTRAFGPGGWAIAPRGPVRTRASGGGELVVYHGALWSLGRFVSESFGQCVYWPKNRGMTFADAAEGARTDCIGRCCKDLGVARDLWDPSWREQWKAKYARQDSEGKWERKSRPSKMTTTPAKSASAPSASSTPPASSAASAASSAAAATGATTPESTPIDPTVAAAETLLTEMSRETAKIIPFPSPPPSDTGEAPTKSSLDELRDLLKTLGWKRQWTQEWFNARFGMAPAALTDVQLRTAYRLLYAWGEAGFDGELYKGTLAAEVAAGRCKPHVTE